MKKKGLLIFLLLSMSGCTLLDGIHNNVDSGSETLVTSLDLQDAQDICLVNNQDLKVEHNCDFIFWLSYWLDNEGLSWPQRREMIKQLDGSIDNQLRKILLSQSSGTPYQDRLRAQAWYEQLMPQLTAAMQEILRVMIYQPNQELLEFESAIATLSKVNSNQSKTIEEQQRILQQQQQQLEQLLKIEASMADKTKENDQ